MNSFKKIIKDKKGGTLIMITVLIMASILTVSLSLGSVVINGLKVSKNQANATQAYFAAEAGAERILWEVRKNNRDLQSFCVDSQYINIFFDGCVIGHPTATAENILPNGSKFYISYNFSTPTTTLTSFGQYEGTRRVVRLQY